MDCFRLILLLVATASLAAAAGSPSTEAEPGRSVYFAASLVQLEAAPPAERAALAESLLAHLPGNAAPVIEDGLATFLFHGEAQSVALAGDMTGWKASLQLERLAGSELWVLSLPLPDDARLDYKFVVDGGRWLLDPLNPATRRGGFGPNSEIAMGDYASPPELLLHEHPPCDRFVHEDVLCPSLGSRRDIIAVRPPGWSASSGGGFLLVHDGSDYVELGSLERVLSYLAAEHPELRLPLCICVPPVDRSSEYAGEKREAFARWIVDTLVPGMERLYGEGSGSDAARPWGSMGASNGGNISLYLARNHPEHFDRVLLMSPNLPVDLQGGFLAGPAEHCRVYLNWGRYDLPKLLPLIESFAAALEARGLPHLSRAYNEGHSWGLWRATLDEGLLYLYGEEAER